MAPRQISLRPSLSFQTNKSSESVVNLLFIHFSSCFTQISAMQFYFVFRVNYHWYKSDIYNCIFKFVEYIKTRNKYIFVNLFSLDIDKEKKDIVRSSTGGLRLQFFQFFYISWVSEQLEQLLNFASIGIGGLRPAPTGQQ